MVRSLPSGANAARTPISSVDEPAQRKRRLFVGIELDEFARASCARVAQALQKTGFDARYESAEKLHVTLAFLGFVNGSRVEEIVTALNDVAARSRALSVALDKLGAFPHERKPRVVYVGAREQGAEFRKLAQSVRGAYVAAGFEFDNDPVAHVTIARVKRPQRPLPRVEVEPATLTIRKLTLFASLPDPARNTSRYETVASAKLDQ